MLVGFLLAAQLLSVIPAQAASFATSSDRGRGNQPVDPSLGECEQESTDRQHSEKIDVFQGLTEFYCVCQVLQFSGERTNDRAYTPEPIALDLHGSRAPPACA
jgi:hypothetical protein